MRLQSLVLCSDEKILRVLRRVLGDLEITIDLCTDPESAIHKLTRQRYEAVIVDCADERVSSQVLRGARSAPCNKRAVAVAILDGDRAVRSAFELGAHFVLYKPLSNERAKSSFRAARALMKCERRRNTRIPVEIPVAIRFGEGKPPQRAVTSDLGEGGIAIQPAPSGKPAGPMTVVLTLPGTEHKIECVVEVAWANSSRQAGLRFVDLSSESSNQLKAWLDSHAPELEKADPPVPCKLTDLSAGGGYLETTAPFPVRAKVSLAIRIADVQAQVEGIVRVTHPESGMGVEFLQRTPSQRQQLDKFIQGLMNNPGAAPEILVQPEGLDGDELKTGADAAVEAVDDPLLDLFRKKFNISAEEFLAELRQQRGPHPESAEKPLPV
jgi:CheY-like chemotaxis protein